MPITVAICAAITVSANNESAPDGMDDITGATNPMDEITPMKNVENASWKLKSLQDLPCIPWIILNPTPVIQIITVSSTGVSPKNVTI